jgi:hypothetical protein
MPINFNDLFRRIRYQFPLGAGNRAADLEKTGNWSHEAIASLDDEHIFVEKKESKGKESKSKGTAFQRFFTSTWGASDEKKNMDGIDGFAIETARDYVGRVANCRGRCGMLITYLLEAKIDCEISLANMMPPIDHVLLVVKPANEEKTYIVDPWTERVVDYNNFNEYAIELMDIIIRNEKARAVAQEQQTLNEYALLGKSSGYNSADELKKEIRLKSAEVVKYCERAKSKPELISDVIAVDKLSSQQKQRFLKVFTEEKDRLVRENYPKPS